MISICLGFLVVLHFQYRITKQKKVHAINKQKLEQAQEKYSNLQHSINESQRIIALLRKERLDFTQETEKYKEEIVEREMMIKKLSVEKEKLRIWLFKQYECPQTSKLAKFKQAMRCQCRHRNRICRHSL